MKHNVRLQSTRLLTRLLILLLCLAMFAGCSLAPDDNSGDNYTDEDATASEPVVSTETIPPERSITIDQQPIDTLLTNQNFAILFVNVGKADATILRFGDTTVLIDTGSAESVPQLIAGLNALNISHIDAVLITHSHSDHLGGLDALSANYEIPMVYSALYADTDKNDASKIVKRAEKLDLNHQELLAGDTVSVADGISLTVLGPLSLSEEDDNDNSLVLQLSYGGKKFLFVGDMQFTEELEIMDSGVSLKSDVLKVGNHGNPDATSNAFGAAVAPAYAVISTDTAVDTDSANPRVYAALPTAQFHITQDFPIGVLLTLDKSGEIVISNPEQPMQPVTVEIEQIDVDRQTVTLVNNGNAPVDLSGYILFSVRSDATLRFPEETILEAGGTLTIGKKGDIAFPGEDKPFNKKKDNTVQLFSPLGRLLAEQTN